MVEVVVHVDEVGLIGGGGGGGRGVMGSGGGEGKSGGAWWWSSRWWWWISAVANWRRAEPVVLRDFKYME